MNTPTNPETAPAGQNSVPLYTATFDDGSPIYRDQPEGNLYGALPLGSRIQVFGDDEGHPFGGARGVATISGREFTIRRTDAKASQPS